MFENLTKRLSSIFSSRFSSGVITESQLDDVLREIRIVLLEADVSLIVVKDFISKIKTKAVGRDVVKSVTAKQMIIKIIHEELVEILGTKSDDLSRFKNALIVGLQGSGKTTSAAKIAKYLSKKQKVMLVSLDIHRPAAQLQLKVLGDSIGVDVLPVIPQNTVAEIIERALEKRHGYDVLIFDTAGRLHIDVDMINELRSIHDSIKPDEVLFVIDSMVGQDAVNIAKSFNESIGITGAVLTRVDGDTRGGAALSFRSVTGKPIKFIGNGEGLDSFDVFDPERFASRILDMGDIVSLVEMASSKINKDEAEDFMKKISSGQKFTLEDYMKQIMQIRKLGSIKSIMSLLPGMAQLNDRIDNSSMSDEALIKQIAIIQSMTKEERVDPNILNHSRKQRIIRGSGSSAMEINMLLKQYLQMNNIMKQVANFKQGSFLGGGISRLFSGK